MKTSKLFTKSMVVAMLSTTALSVAPITASANSHHKHPTTHKKHSKITKNKDTYKLRNGNTVKFATKRYGHSEMPYVYTLKHAHKVHHSIHIVKHHAVKKHTKKKSFLTNLKDFSKRLAEKRAKTQKARKAKAAKFKANLKKNLKKHWYSSWLA